MVQSVKPKSAFVDHSFHKKTKAADFFRQLLAPRFNLCDFWDESWRGGRSIPAAALGPFEYIFYFQNISGGIETLEKLKGKKIIWIPMFDGVVGMSDFELLNLVQMPMKVIAFSRELFERLSGLGFQCFYLQYFPNPKSFQPVVDYSRRRVYFWNRIPNINWETVKTLLGNQIDSVTYAGNPDPGFKSQLPLEGDIKRFQIKIYRGGFLPKEKYLALVSKANIYIAPRVYEGIGMSFLEAMARGQCVVAHDAPTMNEYIKNGQTGYLFNLNNLKPLEMSRFEEVARNARKYMENGFKKYHPDSQEALDFIASKDWPTASKIGVLVKFGSRAKGFLRGVMKNV